MRIIPVLSDITQGEGNLNPSTKSQTVRFRRAFWKNYAEVHPETPKAVDFLEGFGNANPQYRIKEVDLFIKQWLGTVSGGVYVQAKHDDSHEAVQDRIKRYWPRFRERFEDITYNDGRSWFVLSLRCEGGTRNFWNWDEAAAWLEERRKQYEEILSR